MFIHRDTSILPLPVSFTFNFFTATLCMVFNFILIRIKIEDLYLQQKTAYFCIMLIFFNILILFMLITSCTKILMEFKFDFSALQSSVTRSKFNIFPPINSLNNKISNTFNDFIIYIKIFILWTSSFQVLHTSTCFCFNFSVRLFFFDFSVFVFGKRRVTNDNYFHLFIPLHFQCKYQRHCGWHIQLIKPF